MKKQKKNEFIDVVKDTTKKILLANLDVISNIYSEELGPSYDSSDPSDPEGYSLPINNGKISLATFMDCCNIRPLERKKITKLFEKKLGKFKEVHRDSEYDYGSGTCTIVYHFIKHDKYIKYTGAYNSYGDVLYSNLEEVKPVEKTIIAYKSC